MSSQATSDRADHGKLGESMTATAPAAAAMVSAISADDGDPSTVVLRNRGVPSTMGTVRLGGSGRPFPVASGLQALSHSAASHREGSMPVLRATTVVRPADSAASDKKRHASLERHPSSPSGRKIECTQKLILVPDESERFQVRKSIIKTLPHKRKLQGDSSQTTSSIKQKVTRPVNLEMKKKNDPSPLPRSLQTLTITTKATTRSERSRLEVREPILATPSPAQQQQVVQRPPAIDTRHEHLQGFSAPMQTTKQVNRDGTCHSVVEILPCQHLFTQRTEDHNITTSASKAFHTAFHEHSSIQSCQQGGNATAITSHMPTSSGTLTKTLWRQVDESIEHIYEDPSTDFVQLKLLAHKSGESSKRQKLLERERVLAAASELREREARERAHFEELQRKKSQVEQLSEAIRARNRKLISKSEPVYDIVDRVGAGAAKRYEDAVQDAEPKRKPPVPRQRGRRKAQFQTRNSQLKAATNVITQQLSQRSSSAPVDSVSGAAARGRPSQKRQQSPQPGSVSSSILLGDSGEFAMKDVRQSIGEESQEGEPSVRQDISKNEAMSIVLPPPEQSSEAEQRPLVQPQKRPRAARRTPRPHKSLVHEEEQPIHVVTKEKSERRELAREFMDLQKQSRQLRSAKEKQRIEEEKQRRRLQLEKLEQERIESLRRSKKRNFKRSRVSPRAESDRHSSLLKSFRGRSEADDKSAAEFPVSDEEDAVDEADKFYRIVDDDRSGDGDKGDEFFASDQENQLNNRNRSFERVFENMGGHDASVLIGYSSADDKHSPVAASTKEANVRLQRLLALEEKATRLSMLVNGIKGRKATALATVSLTQRVAIKEDEQASEDDLRFPTPRQGAGLDDGYDDQVAKSSRHDEDGEESSSAEEKDAFSSGDEEREVTKPGRRGEGGSHSDEGRPSFLDEALDFEEDDIGSHLMVGTHSDWSMHAEKTRVPASTPVDVESMAAQLSYLGNSHELDPRTIGVHSIKVQWSFMDHQSGSEDADSDRDHTRVSHSHSSASPRSSPRSERHQFDHNQLLSSSRVSVDSNCSADPFEASIHAYMQQRQRINQEAEDRHEASSSHSSPRVYRAELAVSADRHHHQRSTPSNHTVSEANEAFLRLVREADDSLSVINSTAHKIWLQQQQKLQDQAEKQRQRELEALIEEQERKNQQLQAVMDSLTNARHISDSDHGSESGEEQAEVQFEHERNPSSLERALPYNRLEDIMQQIQDEKLREKQAAVPSPQQQYTNDPELHNSKQPASLFWNDMLASSEPLTRNTINHLKQRTVIDRSELLKQQTQREPHEAQDVLLSQSYQDELKRVHSPKTLSRLLLAEVEYNDAIHDAHLQLSIMEHAQVIEQAQEETINVTTAFKEEMESNLTNHQLALEHAILSKHFDGDLQDVMQELEVIQRTQAQELANTTVSMHNELKLANLREVMVQTEELRRADVATNAKLYTAIGTATSPLVCDAGVQYEPPESSPLIVDQSSLISQQLQQVQALIGVKAAVGAISADEEAYSEEEYEEDNFERESQSVLTHDSAKKSDDKPGTSSGSVNSEIPEDNDELHSAVASDHVSEVRSDFSEDEDLTENPRQSVAASSTDLYEDDEIHSEAYDEEEVQSEDKASVASSAIDEASAFSDRRLESRRSDLQTLVASASMGYEDDFNVSTSQVQAAIMKRNSDVDPEEIADDDAESEVYSTGSVVSDVIEEDDVPSESGLKEKRHGVVTSEDSEYSSEFSSGAAKDESKGTPPTAAKAVTTADRAMPTEIKPGQTAVLHVTETEHNTVSRLAITGTDGVMPAYQRDLEQRKQSDESLLHLRLQVLERRFQVDVRSIDEAMGNVNGVPGKLQELLLRKEALKMAFLSEKAGVESLKAASMAHYYQDLLAFQSLMAGVDPSFSAAVVPVQRTQHTSVFEARSDHLSRVVPDPASMERDESEANTTTDSVKNDYEDEFDTVSEKAVPRAENDEEISESDVKFQPSVGDSKDSHEASVIEEEEESSANESVEKEIESDHVDESDGEGDAYEDEFASVSKSDAVDSFSKPGGTEGDDGDVAIDDDFEKEDASIRSEAPSQVDSVDEDEFDSKPDSVKSKDDGKRADQDEDYDDYDDYEDEFASVSESDGAKPSSQAPAAVEEDEEIMDEESENGGGHQSEDETSQAPSENVEDDFESSGEPQGITVIGQEVALKVGGDLLYSNDFETSAARDESAIDESQSASKQQLDIAESIMVAATPGEQLGSSEDSSTTKLLIEQVHHLQQQAEKHISEADVQHTEEKLTRKKIKAIELVQAKERLIKLEKNKFKLEEEQRQVNTLAQLAIEMDVNEVLSKAKEQIKQQLEVEMADVQQSFPAFAKASNTGAAKAAVVPGPAARPTTDAIKAHSAATVVAAPATKPVLMKEAPLKTQILRQTSKTEDGLEDEYEVDSFEEEQSKGEIAQGDGDDEAYDEEYPSYAEEEDESQVEEHKPANTAVAIDESDGDSEIAFEGEDEFASVAGDGADGSEIRSEASMDEDDGTAVSGDRDVQSDTKVNEEEASMDEYADESFDDGNSVRSTQLEDAEIQQKSEENDDEQADEYEDEAYSEEDFEEASEASVIESKHLDEDGKSTNEDNNQDALHPIDTTSEIHSKVQEEQHHHVSIDELAAALSAVTSQLCQPAPDAAPVDLDTINLTAHDLSMAFQADQVETSHALPAQMSTSVSHEEEILSKSIEEQTKRLEELKQMILARKGEIMSVQKHMRIEKRKEQLTSEERLLWNEVEHVEANLRMDEAALELTRHRNRLEVMRLEAKHEEHKAKLTGSTPARSIDLLEGFDFVEAVESPDVEASCKDHEATESKANKTLWGATSDGICQTDSSLVAGMTEEYDLLTGYVYVEEVESVPAFSEDTLPTVSSTMGDADKTVTTNDHLSDDEAAMHASGDEFSAPMDDDETLLSDQEADAALIHKAEIQGPFQEDGDLLSGYSYLEDVELLMKEGSDTDLLVSFDFVEEVDSVGSSHEPNDRDGGLEPGQVTVDMASPAVELSNDLVGDEGIGASKSEGDKCTPPIGTKNVGDHKADLLTGSPAYQHPEDHQQPHIPCLSAASQSGSQVTFDGIKLADSVVDAIYGDLFDDIWKDSWELRREATLEMKQERDRGGPSRKLDEVEAKECNESVESIAADTETAAHEDREQPSEEATHTSITTSDTKSRTSSSGALANELTDTLFDELYGQVLSEGVLTALSKKISKKQNSQHDESRAKERQETTGEETIEKTSAAPVVSLRAEPTVSANRRPSAASVVERAFVGAVVQRLEISTRGIRLPAFSQVIQPVGLRSARVVFESVREIAASVYSRRMTIIAHDDIVGDDQQQEIDIEALKQEVQVEIERVLSLRDAGNDELKKRTHNLFENDMSDANSEETSQDDHLRLMQSQFRTSVSHVTDHMRRNLLTGGAITAVSGTPGTLPRSFYPRTPTPRASSSSSHHRPAMLLHTLLRHESAQLHERITDLILDDLLSDNTTTSHSINDNKA